MKRPTLSIDKKKVIKNIDLLVEKAHRSNVIFRPHFKTHQSAEIGELFKEKGVDKITVSSVSMAKYFAEHGWHDITIAFPVNLREVDKINELAGKIQLNLLVDSTFSAKRLTELLTNETGIFIEIDNGYNRSGLLPTQTREIDQIVELVSNSDKLKFKGFLSHAGNTYSARGKAEVLAIMHDAAKKLNKLKSNYINRFPNIITSFGDTPSCSITDDLSMFDEIRPGNFVYYDVMQYLIGSCSLDDIAVAVACPVVSVYPNRKELIIYGGAVHLSKEFIMDENSTKIFGLIVEINESEWSKSIPDAYVSSISQEHGIIKIPSGRINDFKPGDMIGVLPIHSCLTANLLKNHQIII